MPKGDLAGALIRTALQLGGDSMDGLFELDEDRWLHEQVALLKAGDLAALDREHLVEYLTAMAARDRREVQQRLTILLHHLLKVKFQPGRATRSWVLTIHEQQRALRLIFKDMPSLRIYALSVLDDAYDDAVDNAAIETGLPKSHFQPAHPVWTLDSAMNFDATQIHIPKRP